MKYPKTWKAIDEALERSRGLSEYPKIKLIMSYVRQFPSDADLIDWNLVVCAGSEMDNDPASSIWNQVIHVWNEERKEVADAKSKSSTHMARTT